MTKRIMPLLVVLLSLSVAAGTAFAAQTPQIPIAGKTIPQFVQPLPRLSISGGPDNTMATVFGNQSLKIHMCEFDARVLPAPLPLTRVWGYVTETPGTNWTSCPTEQDTYIGPVIVNTRGSSTDITWINDLGNAGTTQVLAYKYSTDQTLHWADPLHQEANVCNHMDMSPSPTDNCSRNYGEVAENPGEFSTDAPIPAVVHLHGGEVPPELDGGPDAWFTSDGSYQGHGYYSFPGAPANAATYKYPNKQEAAPIWFHDHTLGVTRLGVYAGLAGAYYIQDNAIIPVSAGGTCADNCLPANLQSLGEVVPIVLQDRTFDTNGQLFLHADSAGGLLWSPNPEHPYWVPEFVGDVIVVNGKAWPTFAAQQKRYRFLFLNGSNARTYEMFLVHPVTGAAGPNMWVIATDGGYLDAPVMVKKLTMMPGERYEVIIDFAGFPGQWLLKNTGKTPFPAGAAPQGATTAKIMMFDIAAGAPVADSTFNPATPGQVIRPNGKKIVRLPGAPGGPGVVTTGTTKNVQATRALTLNEVMGMPQNVIDPVTGILTAYPGGPLEILVNNTKWSGERITGVTGDAHYIYEARTDFTLISVGSDNTYYSELPKEGDTEIWEIVNLTADAHPIHLHLVQFQLIDRQSFNTNTYNAAYNAAFPGGGWDPMLVSACAAGVFCPGYGPPLPYKGTDLRSGGKLGGNPDVGLLAKNGKPVYLQGKPMPPAPSEQGWKDTVIAYPGQVTRLAVRWAPTDLPTTAAQADLHFPFDPYDGAQHGYVWHCHIIDHEDNEMMRPVSVGLNPFAPTVDIRPLKKGTNY